MFNYVRAETEWELARLGKFTASQIDKLFSAPRDKAERAAGLLSRTAKEYIESRAAEAITGFYRQYEIPAMAWGTQTEPQAADRLMEVYPNMTYHGKKSPLFLPYSELSGSSPDATDLTEGVIPEIKCPYNPTVHLRYCMLENDQQLKKQYRKIWHQIQMNMVCASFKYSIPFEHLTGAFCSFSPLVRYPYVDLFILPVRPDREFADTLPYVIAKAEKGRSMILEMMIANNLQSKAA